MSEFEDLVIQNLGEIKESLADVQSKTTDLCTRHSVVEEKVKTLETSWKTHLNEEVQSELRKSENKWKLPAVIASCVSTISMLVAIFK